VGLFPANGWGLHDLHGNVWEWCLDFWHSSFSSAPYVVDSWAELTENYVESSRLLRGGSWDDIPGHCRSAYRNRLQPDNAFINVGFRVVCLPQGPSLNP
jgi:formylglycine-generating enzyme required for sulfatase activity